MKILTRLLQLSIILHLLLLWSNIEILLKINIAFIINILIQLFKTLSMTYFLQRSIISFKIQTFKMLWTQTFIQDFKDKYNIIVCLNMLTIIWRADLLYLASSFWFPWYREGPLIWPYRLHSIFFSCICCTTIWG